MTLFLRNRCRHRNCGHFDDFHGWFFPGQSIPSRISMAFAVNLRVSYTPICRGVLVWSALAASPQRARERTHDRNRANDSGRFERLLFPSIIPRSCPFPPLPVVPAKIQYPGATAGATSRRSRRIQRSQERPPCLTIPSSMPLHSSRSAQYAISMHAIRRRSTPAMRLVRCA